MRLHRLILTPAMAAALVFAVLGGASLAAAQDGVTVPAGTVIRGSEGDVIELGRIPVDTARAGPRCSWTATATNQSSVHPGNHILVETNGVTLVLADVEGAPNKVTSNTGTVFLADEVVVSLQLGPDGLFSGGMVVSITYDETCEPVETTTTTESEVEDTTPSTPTSETTSTSSTTELEPAGPEVTEPESPEPTEPEGPDVSATDSTTTTDTVVAPATTPTTTPTAPEALPVTGSELTLPLVGAGVALSIVGLGLVSASRPRPGRPAS